MWYTICRVGVHFIVILKYTWIGIGDRYRCAVCIWVWLLAVQNASSLIRNATATVVKCTKQRVYITTFHLSDNCKHHTPIQKHQNTHTYIHTYTLSPSCILRCMALRCIALCFVALRCFVAVLLPQKPYLTLTYTHQVNHFIVPSRFHVPRTRDQGSLLPLMFSSGKKIMIMKSCYCQTTRIIRLFRLYC